MLPSWLEVAALVVLGILLVPHVLGPFLVLFTLKFRLPVEVIPVDPRTEPLPQSVREYFDRAYRVLTADGFELVGVMVLPSVIPNVRSLFALYANRATREMAMSTLIVGTGQGQQIQTRYIEFVTRFTDGVVVQTNNSRELGAFKPLPDEYTMQFWDVEDTHALYELHRLAVDKFRRAGQPVLRLDSEFGGDAVRFVARAVLEETFEDQVGTGYLVRTEDGFRASPKGALIMAWQELWPCKALRRASRRSRARAFLREHAQVTPLLH